MKRRVERIFLNNKKDLYEDIIIYESEFGPVINGYFSSFYKSNFSLHLDLPDQDKFYYINKANYIEDKFSNGFRKFFFEKDFHKFRNSLQSISISLNVIYSDVG